MASQAESKTSSSRTKSPELPATNNGGALSTNVGSNVPDFMREDSRLGKENISAQDMVMPRVALMQAVNPEVMDGKVDSAHFWHTVAEADLGDVIDDLVVVHHSKRYTLWNPRHMGGGVLARANDGVHWDNSWSGELAPFKDIPKLKVKYEVKAGEKVGRDIGLGRWGTMNPDDPDSPPAATLTHVLVCVLLSRLDMGPFALLLQRSAEPVAKMLLSKINVDTAPIFGQVYLMNSKVVPNASGEFNQYTFAKNGHIEDRDVYQKLKDLNAQLQATGIKVDDNAEQEEAERDRAGSKGAGAEPDSKDNKY